MMKCQWWALLLVSPMGCSGTPPLEPLDEDSYALESPAHWSTYRRSPRRTAFNPDETLLTRDSVVDAHVVWEVGFGSRSLLAREVRPNPGESPQPEIGVLFAEQDSGSRSVVSLDVNDGRMRWTNRAGARGSTYLQGALVALYAASELDELVGLGARTGLETHRVAAPPRDEGAAAYSRPFAASENPSDPDAGQRFIYLRSQDGFPGERGTPTVTSIWGVDFRAGGSWGVELSADSSQSQPAAANGYVIVSASATSDSGQQYSSTTALKLATGETRWRMPVGGSAFGAAILGGRVFVGSVAANEVVALRERDGAELWRHSTGAAFLGGSPAVAFARLIVAGDLPGGGVQVDGVNPVSGELAFRTTLSAGALSAPPVIGGDVVYVGTQDGILHALALDDGSELQAWALDGAVLDVIVLNGHLYVGTTLKTYALGLEPALARAPNADGPSSAGGSSEDGSLVVFASQASNLVSPDTNGAPDVFVYDRNARRTERVSVGVDGAEANGKSYNPVIDASGRFVAFVSDANNLVLNDTNDVGDVFLYDRQTLATTRVNATETGLEASLPAHHPCVSGDGRFVAFTTEASLSATDTNAFSDVYVYDRTTGHVERVSQRRPGLPANRASYNPRLSFDGRFVAFESLATNLVSGDTNAHQDVFVYDRDLQRAERISAWTLDSRLHGISADGVKVLLQAERLELRDRQAQSTSVLPLVARGGQLPLNVGAAELSADGAHVAYAAVIGSGMSTELFVLDLAGGRSYDVSRMLGSSVPADTGATARGFSLAPGGQSLLLTTPLQLTQPDFNGVADAYVLSLATMAAELVTVPTP